MHPLSLGAVAGSFGVLAIIAIITLRHWARVAPTPLPPGPKPLPVIGNLLDLPTRQSWLTHQAWCKLYGDVVYVQALGRKMVILGSAAAVNDLIERRGAAYADRKVTPMVELTKFYWSFAMLPYGDAWRRKRKMLHAHVHQGVIARYRPIQVASARRLARDILKVDADKEALPRAIRLNFGQTIMEAVYGIEVNDPESEFISLPEKVLDAFSVAFTPGRFLVDYFPFLKYVPEWVPGAGFKRFAREHRMVQRRALDLPVNAVKTQMAEGTAPPSMARSMLEEDATLPSELSQLETIKDVAGAAYIAGSDTTVAAVMSFFLAMLIHPEVQSKAQAEVDRIIGKDRLPEFDDKDSLPYVQSVVNECLRWLPVIPSAVRHLAHRDDEYKGYLIPKGSIIIASAWGILHNSDDYPEPDRFYPERYLDPEGKLDKSVRDPRTACYGFGRRICPGRFLADASLFMTVVTLLATVDIVRAKDDLGTEIIPKVEVSSGIISHPKPFPWAVRPRSGNVDAVLTSVGV